MKASVYETSSVIDNPDFQQLARALQKIAKKEKLSVETLVDTAALQEPPVPCSIFAAKQLTCFEAVVLFLRDHDLYTFTSIATLLNRDVRTIWATYHRAVQKRSDPLPIDDTSRSIPVSIFRIRRVSPLQAIILYLRNVDRLRFSDIARTVHRDPRNVWSVYQKAKVR